MTDLFTTEEDGITVTKNVESNGDEVQIGLRLNSSRDDPLTVRVIDTVPANSTVRALSTDETRWSSTNDTVEYERTLEPEESITTGYKYTRNAIDAESHQPPELLVGEDATEVETDVVTASEEDDSTVGSGSGELVEADEFEMPEDEVTMTEMVTETAPETDESSAESDPPPTTGSSEEAASRRSGSSHAAGETGDDIDDVIDVICRTLQADATTAQRDRLAELLDDLDRSRTSLDLRVASVQSQVQDLRTYVDALEAFLDEKGTAEDVLTEVSNELAAVRDEVESVRDEQTSLDARVERIDDRVDRLESSFEERHEALRTEFDRLESTFEDRREVVEDDFSDLQDALGEIEAEQRTIQADVEQFTAFRETIEDAFRRDLAVPEK